ncbi:Lar family restriction alleviation protein [Eubacterium callanderi]|uniref:Lar family restriction alleviation protein n=1 Tax=Eubacterium callanderi TaxID=53442 RepID=UPI001D1492D8|nr:Lar family restriction alleviation protein [Eubacterium callanderi]MCC3401099.1 restriction alleviation protein, Lar family [Eubacterium callanderi]
MTKLKRCPFCGGEASLEVIRENEVAFCCVECDQCGISTYNSTNMKEVVDIWNTRTPEIVRCGECRHFDGSEIAGRCALTTPENLEDNEVYWEIADFCSYGERREEK